MEKFKGVTIILAGISVIAILALMILPIFNLKSISSYRETDEKLGEIAFFSDYANSYKIGEAEVASITKTFLIFIIVMFTAITIFNLKKSILPVIIISLITSVTLLVMWASADMTYNEMGSRYHVAPNTGFGIPLLMSLATLAYSLVKIVVDSFKGTKKKA